MHISYREFLPKSTFTVHAATVEIWQDHPVFAWFGGSREGASDVAIYLYNLHDDKKYITIGKKDHLARWNPILFSYNDRLFLFEKAGRFCDCWQTFLHDVTEWDNNIVEKQMKGQAQSIPAGLNGAVKTRPCIDGDKIICGSSVETWHDWTSYIETYQMSPGYKLVFTERSDPLHIPIKYSYISPQGVSRLSQGIIQPSVWMDDNEQLHALFRPSGGLQQLYCSHCIDRRWSKPQVVNIPNPNSGIDTVYKDGKLYVALNPSTTNRYPLEIWRFDNHDISLTMDSLFSGRPDEKITIADSSDFGDKMVRQELSYPYMVEKDGQIHLVYTYSRTQIEYCIIDM